MRPPISSQPPAAGISLCTGALQQSTYLAGAASPCSPLAAFQPSGPGGEAFTRFSIPADQVPQRAQQFGGKDWKRAVATTVLAAALAASSITVGPAVLSPGARAALPALRVERSAALALSEEQALVQDVWREVSKQYVDGSFNGLGADGWKAKQSEALRGLAGKQGGMGEAYDAIREMLRALGDPYTRFLDPEQYDALVSNYARGDGAGIGVQLQLDPQTGTVVVLQAVAGGPAALGGVLPGDELLRVDGESVEGATAEVCAALIRGEAGSEVRLAVRHPGGGASGGGGVAELPLERARVSANAVEKGSLLLAGGKRAGLVRISAFTQETAAQLVRAVRDVSPGAEALVIDLRGNAGGYLPAGVEAARLFLPPNAKVVSEVRRDGVAEVFFSEGVGSETRLPLYLLVDGRTASASEVMAAALQDNRRATLVGPGRTFGKGRIQNVQRLVGGSGVSVTKARYVTPAGRDIHGVGLLPDVVSAACGAADSAAACMAGVRVSSTDVQSGAASPKAAL